MTKQVHGKSATHTGSGGGQSKAGKLKEKKSQTNASTKANQTAAANAAAATAAAAAASAANAQKVDSKLLTPEQRRLASLMNDKIDVNEIEKKVNKIIELTGASKDKAIVALHDCANELDKAIDMILEGDSLNEGEWKSQVRKRKPKVTGSGVSAAGGNKENSGDFGSGRHQHHQNGEGRGGRGRRDGPPRGDRSGRGKGESRRPRDNYSSSNFTKDSATLAPVESSLASNTEDAWEAAADDDWGEPVVAAVPETFVPQPISSASDTFSSKPRFSSAGSSLAGQPKPGFRSGSSDRPQIRGSYAGKAGLAPNRGGPPRTYQNKQYPDESNFPNSIDTWSNDPTAAANTTTGAGTATGLSNPTNEFDNKIGNWSDMAEGETISEEDWDAAPMETKVFTSSRSNEPPKPKMPNLADIVSGRKPPTAAAIVKGLTSSTTTEKPSAVSASETIAPNVDDKVKVGNESTPSLTEQITSDQLASLAPPPSQSSGQPIQQSIDHSVPPTNFSLPIASSNQIPQSNKIDLADLLKSSAPSQPTAQPTTTTPQQQTSAQPQHSQPSNVAASTAHQPSLNQLISSGQLPGARQSNAAAGVALLQQLTQSTNAPSGYRPMQHYSKQASENLKNLVGIPTNPTQSNQFSANGQQFADNSVRQQHQQHHPHQQHPRSAGGNRIPSRRSTKIPESAVEMPNPEHISSLNVQFGALDFGTDSFLTNEAGANPTSGTSFSDLQPPKPPTQPHKLPAGQPGQTQQTHAPPGNVAQTNLNQMLTQVQGEASSYSKTSNQELSQMASQLVSSQQLSDSVLERAKQNVPSNSGPAAHHYGQKPGLYGQQAAGGDSGPTQMSYKYGGESASNSHYGSGYGQSQSAYGYSSGNTQPAGYGVNAAGSAYGSYGSGSMTATSNPTNGPSHQKLTLKDMENSSGNSSNNLSNQSLGLVSSSTVTTNVLKNTLTATGKTGSLAPNVAPGVNPLLGTPQYVISQPGLSAFYPIYDMPLAGREHNFAPYAPQQPSGPSTAPDSKYGSRTDPTDTNTGVQSSQAPVTQPAGHLFGQFPPHYGFFYTGVNMMPQSLYQTAGPFLQMQPPNPAAAAAASGAPSAHSQGSAAAAAAAAASGFSKPQSQAAYGSHSAFSNYGLSAQMQAHGQDYGGKSYGSQSVNASVDSQQGSQSASSGGPSSGSKQNTGSSANDLSSSNMYTKSHAQLTKNYDKPNFQTGTPPPFNMANAQMNASALGSYQNQYIPMMQPQSNPSMLHHSLQSDASGNQRSMGQSQKNTNSNKYYNWN